MCNVYSEMNQAERRNKIPSPGNGDSIPDADLRDCKRKHVEGKRRRRSFMSQSNSAGCLYRRSSVTQAGTPSRLERGYNFWSKLGGCPAPQAWCENCRS